MERDARAWLELDPDPHTRAELEAILDGGDPTALAERFGGRLEFGTAGLRGILGAGPRRMNRLVIRQTTAGLGRYLLDHVPDAAERGVVVAHDARRNSGVFAADTARVLLGLGLRVHLAESLWPTPMVAFAVRDRGAAGGVMVTASHNPPDYNGYKVYWENGAQIIPPHDQGISAAIAAVDSAGIDLPALEGHARLVTLGDEIIERYLEGVAALGPHPDAARRAQITIAYTPLHGVGARFVETALARAGFSAVHTEPSQREPDGAFPTVAFPNPEEKGAMDRVLDLAGRARADLVLASDPDVDRLAVAIPEEGGYRMLTGDQIGLLLADYLLEQAADGERLLSTTVVSSQLLGRMAEAAGVTYAETLTGFKWIANAAIEHAAEGRRLVLGYEEALGYCIGDLVRDKDGISAAAVFAEMVAFDAALGRTVAERLSDIYRRFGLYLTEQFSLSLPGAEGLATIAAHMRSFRERPPEEIGGHRVVERRDLMAGGNEVPKADVLIFRLEGDRRVIMRPSGTEPKLKSYYEVREPIAGGEPVDAGLDRARTQLRDLRQAHQALIAGRQ
jgi:phosphomannomutase